MEDKKYLLRKTKRVSYFGNAVTKKTKRPSEGRSKNPKEDQKFPLRKNQRSSQKGVSN